MLRHNNPGPVVPKRVVVLGARGFIGKVLVDALARQKTPTLALSSAELDLSQSDAGAELAGRLQTGDAVVILSALTPDKGHGADIFLKNVQIAASVGVALEKVPPAHVVYVSSDRVYSFGAGLVSESSRVELRDLYGAMHLSREVMFKIGTKSPVAILRPTLVFGVGDTHNSYGPNLLRRMARKEGKITLSGEGEETRDHIHVDDVVALVLLTLHHRSAGLLNLATGRSVSYAELARKVVALFDRPIKIVTTPRQNPVTHRHFDITALRAAFPSFVFTPLDEGLARAHRGMFELE